MKLFKLGQSDLGEVTFIDPIKKPNPVGSVPFRNREKPTGNLKGVTWCTRTNLWRADQYSKGKQRNLGRFETFEEAAIAALVAQGLVKKV